MKILLLTSFPVHEKELTINNLKRQYHIFTYMIYKYLSKYPDLEIDIKYEHEPLTQQYTHCVFVENRGLLNRDEQFINKLRSHVSEFLCTFSASHKYVGIEDVLFYMVPSGKRNKRRCKLLNWNADSELIMSKQDPSMIRILIDHNYYGPYKSMINTDLTKQLTDMICEYVKDKPNYLIKRFIKGGVEIVNPYNITELEQYQQGNGLNYEEACNEYSHTDIFIVTHRECMGLSVLESAMAGARIIAPKDYIKQELIRDLDHILIDPNNLDSINWEECLSPVNHSNNRQRVLKYSWENGCKKIYNTLINYEKFKLNDLYFKNNH